MCPYLRWICSSIMRSNKKISTVQHFRTSLTLLKYKMQGIYPMDWLMFPTLMMDTPPLPPSPILFSSSISHISLALLMFPPTSFPWYIKMIPCLTKPSSPPYWSHKAKIEDGYYKAQELRQLQQYLNRNQHVYVHVDKVRITLSLLC